MKTLITMSVLMFLAAGPAQAQENLLCDGGFEVADQVAIGTQPLGPLGDLGCWSIVGDDGGVWIGEAVQNPQVPSIEGELVAHIGNSVLNGAVEQSFETNIGSEYQVSLWGFNWNGFGDGEATVRVYNDQGENDLDAIFTAGESQNDIAIDPLEVWSQHFFTFVATSTLSTVEILNCGGGCFGSCSSLGSACGHAMSVDDVQVISLAPVIVAPCNNELVVQEEGETTDCFTVVLTEPPGAEVTMSVDPSTADVSLNAEAPNDPITLTFGTGDWDTPQTVTVKANDDALAEGLEVVPIVVAGTSADDKFNFGAGIGATVVDNDAAGIQTEESQGSTDPQEGGNSDSYTIVLNFAPTGDVDIRLLVNDDLEDANQVVVDPENLTFTPANWETPQAVTVTAVDDAIFEPHPHPAAVSHTVNSTDEDYNGFAVDDIAVKVGENDCDVSGAAGAGQVFFDTDLDLNCFTDINDLAIFVSNYLLCAISICP